MTKDIHLFNLYLNRFLGDLIPIMPILGLLFLDRSFSLSTISLFFLCLAVTVLLVEIPAGVLADTKNARLVIIISRLFKLLAFVLLLFAMSIPLLCLTAVLWGIASALDSGAMQSYTFQLVRQKKLSEKFEHIYGYTFTSSLLGLLTAGLIASQIGWLGFATIQYVGIFALTLCVLSAFTLPYIKETIIEAKKETQALSITLKSLLKLPLILIILLSVGVLAGGVKGALDEYTTILLSDKQLTVGIIGYIIFGLEILKTTGAMVAARFKLNISRQIIILILLGFAFLVASIGNYLVVIFALVVILFIDAILWVHNDTAIQRHASDDNRATVASIKNFGTEAIAGSVFLITWLFGSKWEVDYLYFAGGILLIIMSFLLFGVVRRKIL
jgi:MFS family permease